MDAEKHSGFTGMDAEIDAREGGKFVTCGKRNWGYSLHLEPGKRIVQAWRQQAFPEGRYSVIDLTISKAGEDKSILNFYQFGIPEGCRDWLDAGWHETYWEPLRRFLEEGLVQARRE